jgi:prevent-host-death family protein
MRSWPVQDAKARFSELLEASLSEGPQLVTRRGAEAAVLVPIAEWRRLQRSARPSLKALLLTDEARVEIPVPRRGRRRRRTPAGGDQ